MEVERFREELDGRGREQEGCAEGIEYAGSKYDISWFWRAATLKYVLIIDRIVGPREANSVLIQLCGLFVEALSLRTSDSPQPLSHEVGL